MKIARIVTSLNPENGGVTEAINQYVSSLPPSKNRFCLVCFDEPTDLWIIALKSKGIEVCALGGGMTSYQFHLGYIKWLKSNYKKYDLFFFDGVWQFHIAPAIFFKLLRVKYIIQPHGMLSHATKGMNISYIKKLCSWVFVERVVTKNASRVVFTTIEEERAASASYPFNAFRSKVIPLGIEGYTGNSGTTPEFINQFLPSLVNSKYILFLGRIDEIKGIELLIDSILENNVFHKGYKYLIVGPDSGGLTDRLKRKVVASGRSEYFFWYGMVSGGLKWDVISNANAFILPSYHENFGIVVTEAMSASVPVLISDNVNINETVLKYGGGIVFSNSPESISSNLLKWFDMRGDMQVLMGESAQKCFQLEFNREQMMRSFETLFLEVIHRGRVESE